MKNLILPVLFIVMSASAHAKSLICSYGFTHNGIGASLGTSEALKSCVFSCPLGAGGHPVCEVIRGACEPIMAGSWWPDGTGWGAMEFEDRADMFCKLSRR